ncbi:MAG: D-alanyl-D-alanine carboxypeptidase [Clostridia bacterium]|nr:D-alanyl-D-alanine carboxypeptidase [Clostridia bacterium]
MKKKIIISILTVILLLSPVCVFADNNVTLNYNKDEQKVFDNIPEIGCKAAYIAEPKTGKIIYEKNAHEKMYPASTTKILTALVVLEKCKPTDKAVVSKNAIDLVPDGYSIANLKAGEELTISDLLYALLIPSANEAANVLAEHVSGSIEAFAEACNNRAKELGCENLHFVNPNGIHNDNHYCTAYDLYLIAKECQKHDLFNEIVKTTSYTLPATNIYTKNDRVIKNTNYLIMPSYSRYYYSYCTGIKTGTTTPAGECLVASCSHDNIDLISVVLGGETNSKGLSERFYDTKQLFEFVYDNYQQKEIINKSSVITNIDVKHATKDTASLDVVVNTSISSIVPNDTQVEKIERTINLNDNIVAPIEQNEVLGKVTFTVDGLSYTTDLVASHAVEKLPYWLYNTIAVAVMLIILVIIIKIIKRSRKPRKRYK